MRKLGRPYLQHARRHLPQGSDPIPGLGGSDNVVYPTQPIILPISLEAFSSGWNISVTGIVIDSTRRNNFRLTVGSGDSISLIWRLTAGPGDYTLYINSAGGGSYGDMTALIAGAYPTNTRSTGVSAGDWLTIGVYDFSTAGVTYDPDCRRPQDTGATLVSGAWPGFVIVAADGNEGVSTLFQRSTALGGGGGTLLNGGPGYFFFRLDLSGIFDLSEAFLGYNQP